MKWREFKNRLIWKIKKGVYLAIGSVPFVILTTLRRLGLTNLRIGLLSIDRIGHFLHADFILRQSVRDKFSVKELLFFSRKPANQQLYRMFKRRVHVISNSFFYNAFEAVHSFFRHSDVWIEPPFKRSYELINEVAPQLQFLKTEDLEGKKFLESLRIKDNAPFICFSVRDNAYLEKIHPMSSLGGWSYHDYRDCHLDNYLMAVKYLTSLGYFAIRMGYVVGQKMPEMDRVIDYAAKYRTDFSDIYLSAKCKFFLASEAGLNSVPWIFNVPVAYANVAPPLAAAAFNKHDVFIPKKLWDSGKKRFVTFHEIIKFRMDQWTKTDQYRGAGIEIIENSPEEVLGLVKEINARLDGTWVESDEDKDLQERFRRNFPPGHRCYQYPSRIGSDFLRKNIDLLEGSLSRL